MMSFQISDLAFTMLKTRYPHLRGLTDRYEMLQAMLPDAQYEFDTVAKSRGLNSDWAEDDDLVFLKNQIDFLESEIESTGRQLVAILREERLSSLEG